MARFYPIDSDMWNSDTILSYDCLQRDIFFYYHTRPGITTSGVYKVNLNEDARKFRLPNSPSHISATQLEQTISSMPEHFEYDAANRFLWAIKFFQHNGMKRGAPSLVAKSLEREIFESLPSPLWQKVIHIYPVIAPIHKRCLVKFEHSFMKFNGASLANGDTQGVTEKSNFGEFHSFSQKKILLLQSLSKLSSNSNSNSKQDKRGGGGRREGLSTPQAANVDNSAGGVLDPGDRPLLDLFSDYLEYREAGGKVHTEKAVQLIWGSLSRLSECDPLKARLVIEHTISCGYMRLVAPGEDFNRSSGGGAFTPPAQAGRKPRPRSPALSPADICAKAIAASSFAGDPSAAYKAFIEDFDEQFVTALSVTQSPEQAKHFASWLKRFFPPGAPPEGEQPATCSEPARPSFFAKAEAEGLTDAEFRKVPMLMRDLLTRVGPVWRLKKN